MLYEVKSLATLVLNIVLEMIFPAVKSSNSFMAKSFLSWAQTVLMGFKSPLLGGKFMEIKPTFLYSWGCWMKPSLSCPEEYHAFAASLGPKPLGCTAYNPQPNLSQNGMRKRTLFTTHPSWQSYWLGREGPTAVQSFRKKISKPPCRMVKGVPLFGGLW